MDVQGRNVYLTGAMTGFPDNNRASFDLAPRAIRARSGDGHPPSAARLRRELTADTPIELMDDDLASALAADVVVVVRGEQEASLEWADALEMDTFDVTADLVSASAFDA